MCPVSLTSIVRKWRECQNLGCEVGPCYEIGGIWQPSHDCPRKSYEGRNENRPKFAVIIEGNAIDNKLEIY